MKMNLRQIVRNQKLQNFNYNLSDFITEADDEEVEKKDAFAGKTDAKEPKNKYWYVKDGEYKARVNHPGEGWELADKKKAEKAEKEKEGKDTSDEMSVEERKERADDFAASLNLKPSGKDKGVYVDEDGKPVLGFADDGTVLALDIEDQDEKKWEKAISDFNDSTGAVPKPEPKKKESKPAPKKKKKEKETVKDSPKDEKEIEKISASLPESVREADPSIARALHYGYTKIPAAPPARAGEIWTPAPGNASSLFNETVSMIGAELLKENPNMSKEDLSEALEESLGETAAWKGVKPEHINTTIDAAITKHNMTREAMEAADIKPKRAKTKSYYGTAESLQNQYDDIMKHKGPFYGGNGQEITSIPTDTETRMFLENFKDPDTDEKLSEEDIDNMLDNPEDDKVIQRFLALSAYNGGGGGNPSDTATIITDGDKMQFIAFSDKTSLGDQQANSTPNQLINNFYGTMRILEGDGYDFNLEEEKPVPPPDGEDRNISGVIEEQGQKFKDAERNLARAQTAPFNVLARLLKDNNEVAKEIFNETFKQGTRYKAIETVYNNLTNPTVKGKATKEETLDRNLNDPKGVGVTDKQRDAMIEAGIEPLPTWGYYLKEADPDWDGKSEPTSDQVEAAYIARAGDSREFTDPKTGQPTSVGNLLTPADPKRYISNAIGELRKAAVEGKIELDSDDRKAVVNQQREIAKYREESVNALNEMHDDLNEFTVKNENGEESRMGDTLMAMDMVRALHLGMIDDNAPGLFSSGSVHIVAGKHRTSPEAMRECLGGVDNVEDLVKNVRTRPPEKSGPRMPGRGELGGLYESELSRSTKEKVTNDTGQNLYIVDGEYKWAHSNLPDGGLSGASAGPLGPVTGRKVFAYTLDEKGEEIPIGEMSMRTKGGTALQTTYTFAKGLKDCLEEKSAPANESFNALLGSILAEDKQNTLAFHWKKAEDDYPLHYFLRDLNEGSLK